MTLIGELTMAATNRDLERGWNRQTVNTLPELRNPQAPSHSDTPTWARSR